MFVTAQPSQAGAGPSAEHAMTADGWRVNRGFGERGGCELAVPLAAWQVDPPGLGRERRLTGVARLRRAPLLSPRNGPLSVSPRAR